MARNDVVVTITYNRLPEIARKLPGLVGAIVDSTAKRVERNAKESMQDSPRSGRIYKRGQRTHQASARGEAPAPDTLDLINSITSKMTSATSAEVSPGTDYALILETLKERPFMGPAAEAERENFINEMRKLEEML